VTLLYQIRLERGEKHACLSCEAKFYDLGRMPVLCPKCGAEFVEVVRPPSAAHQRRGRGQFSIGRPRPVEIEEEINPTPDDAPRAEDEEKELDDEAEADTEGDTEGEEAAEE